MPDAFGFATPAEIRQSQIDAFNKRQVIAQQGSSGDQLGNALGNIFGPAIRKTIDTGAARKAEALRLVDTEGISLDEAKERAKATVGREFKEVRQARQIQEAQSDMAIFMQGLPGSMPGDEKQAAGMLFMSNKLRTLGLIPQANQLAAQANAAMTASEDAELARDNLRARTSGSIASRKLAEAQTREVGVTGFQQNVNAVERIIGKLNDPKLNLSQLQKDSLLRQKGHLEAKLAKDTRVVGLTDNDVRNDEVLMRKLFTEIADIDVLLNNIDVATEQLQDLDSFDSSVFAGFAKDTLGFMEKFFLRTPDEGEREFMERIIEKEGKPTIIAAKIRHALTGAQMSAFEIVFLTPFLPSPSDSPAQMIGKMKVVREYTQLDRDTRMELFRTGLTESTLKSFETKGARATIEEVVPDNVDVLADSVDEALLTVEGILEAARNQGSQ